MDLVNSPDKCADKQLNAMIRITGERYEVIEIVKMMIIQCLQIQILIPLPIILDVYKHGLYN